MNCTVCGYAMSAFDSGCPRCAQQKGSQPTRPASETNWTQPASPPTQIAPQAPAQGGWTQPGQNAGQPPQNQPYQAPPAAYPPPPQGYPPQNPGYPPPYAPPVPTKKGINPVVIVVLVFFALCSVPIVIAVLTMVGNRVSNTFENAPSTTTVQQAPGSTTITAPQVVNGPSFSEVDSKMDDRLTQWTDAQKEAYWATVEGTRISWSGEVIEVRLDNGGSVSLKCNPKSFASDVMVNLDGSQLDKLPSLSKGQRIIIEGTLNDHSMFGYTITQARVAGL